MFLTDSSTQQLLIKTIFLQPHSAPVTQKCVCPVLKHNVTVDRVDVATSSTTKTQDIMGRPTSSIGEFTDKQIALRVPTPAAR